MFKDQVECYEAITNELVHIIKDQWDSVEIEAKTTGESSINIKAVYFNARGKHSIIDFVMIPRYFYELRKLVSTEDKGFYKVCKFKILNNGKYDTNFEY